MDEQTKQALLLGILAFNIVIILFQVLLWRGAGGGEATWLAFLFAFGTPVFFRQAHLNHNMFLMYATFGAFDCPDGGRANACRGTDQTWRLPGRRRSQCPDRRHWHRHLDDRGHRRQRQRF